MTRWLGWLALAGAVLGWYQFLTPPAPSEVPDGAYRDTRHGFALVRPAGWQLAATETCDRALFMQACVVADLTRDGGSTGATTVVQVAQSPLTVRVSEGTKAELAKAAAEAWARNMDSFGVVSEEIVTIDGLEALKVVGRGVKRAPFPVWQQTGRAVAWAHPEYDLTVGTVVVPSGQSVYLLSFGVETSQRAEHEPAIQGVVDSFRLLERPSPFRLHGGLGGSLTSDLIVGALVGLSLGAVKLLRA